MQVHAGEITATIQGAVNKTMFLIVLLVASSAVSWVYATEFMQMGLLIPLIIGTAVLQIIMTFMIIRNPMRAKKLSISYALLEGITLGIISFLTNTRYPGIVFQAVVGTAGVIFSMLMIYKFRIIRVTENFKIMVATATMGIFFVYLKIY